MVSRAALGLYSGNIRGNVEIERLRRDRERARMQALAMAGQTAVDAGLGAARIGADFYSDTQDREQRDRLAKEQVEARRAAAQAKADAAQSKLTSEEQRAAADLEQRKRDLGERTANRIMQDGGGTDGGGGGTPGGGPAKASPDARLGQELWVTSRMGGGDGAPVSRIIQEKATAMAARLAAEENARADAEVRRRAMAIAQNSGGTISLADATARAQVGVKRTTEQEARQRILASANAYEASLQQADVTKAKQGADIAESRSKVADFAKLPAGLAAQYAYDLSKAPDDALAQSFIAARERLIEDFGEQFAPETRDDTIDAMILDQMRGLRASDAQLDRVKAQAEKARRKPTGGGKNAGGRPLTMNQSNLVGEIETSLRSMDRLKENIRTGSRTFMDSPGELKARGLDAKYLGGLFTEMASSKEAADDFGAFQAQKGIVTHIVSKELEGGVLKDSDRIFWNNMLESAANPDALLKILDNLQTEARAKRGNYLDSWASAGYDTSGYANKSGRPTRQNAQPSREDAVAEIVAQGIDFQPE